MKKTLIGVVITVITMGTLGHFFAKPLLAQVRAALVQNVDEPGRNPYQESQAFNFIGSCSGAGGEICSVSFAPVPAGYRLVVTSVSGRLELENNATVVYLTLAPIYGAVTDVFVPAQVQGIRGSTTYYVFNAQVQSYAEASQTPTFTVVVSQYPFVYDQEVTLTGYYVKL